MPREKSSRGFFYKLKNVIMEHLLKGRLFSWLKEGAQEMSGEQIEVIVQEFVNDLVNWSEEVRDYSEVARGLEGIRIRLQVWDEVYQICDGTGKKDHGEFVSSCRIDAGGARDPVGTGAIGKTGMVCRASG